VNRLLQKDSVVRKGGWISILAVGLVLLTSWLLLANRTQVLAQCGDIPARSSCIVCHETSALLSNEQAWHEVHARKDCCANCHGGNCSTMDESMAHEDLSANPLDDIYTNCHSCHPDDYAERAAVFAAELGMSLGNWITPTPVTIVESSEQPLIVEPDASLPSEEKVPTGIFLAGLVFVMVLTTLIGLVYGYIRRGDMDHA
jgi:hypothetical protein